MSAADKPADPLHQALEAYRHRVAATTVTISADRRTKTAKAMGAWMRQAARHDVIEAAAAEVFDLPPKPGASDRDESDD